MESTQIFTYWWGYEDEQTLNDLVISCYGLNSEGESIYTRITGFKPYIYLELDPKIKWTGAVLNDICKDFKNRCSYISSVKFVKRKKLFYNHRYIENGEWIEHLFPYLLINFENKKSIYFFEKLVKNEYLIRLLNQKTKFKIHEQNASPILQLICNKNLPTANWIKIIGKRVLDEEKTSKCDYEYICNYKNMFPITGNNKIPSAKILSFDIEVNSTNPQRMPNSKLAGDKIFQISCVLGKTDEKEPIDKILITLGKVNMDLIGENTKVVECDNEGDVLLNYTKLVKEFNPQIITGYNIFSFDIPYMTERSRHTNVYYDFIIQGYTDAVAEEKEIKWSSTAYKNQCFKYLDAHGRLYVDMLPIVQRDYKLNNYKLKTVSDLFVGETKDPLTAKDIFKCYRMGIKLLNKACTKEDYEMGKNSLSIVGKYCVQDSILVYKLFNNLQTWFGLVEMATTCNVPIFTLYTQGQQIKVFSQIYKVCLQKNYVVEKDGYTADEDDKLTGAIVLEPIPGVYDKITPFDFTSLYPTTIIAYNICFSTLVHDDDPLDDMFCHIIEYAEHKGCMHDPLKDTYKTKIKEDKILCQEHRYRFLKEPKGIVPVLLEDLLEARSQTRKKQKEIKQKISTVDDPILKSELQFEYEVLEKRQLSYKVSANSVYGAYGTRKGYLPFLAGAQCTTAMGRQNLMLASTHIQSRYNAKLVYGDSVTGDTPILIKLPNDTIDILSIAELGKDWFDYDVFKSNDVGLKRKEQSRFDAKVWTKNGWADIKRVIRHKTNKKLYEVITPNSYVKVTEDHSLINSDGEYIKPIDLYTKHQTLYHSWPDSIYEYDIDYRDDVFNIEDARLLGICIASTFTSCGDTSVFENINSSLIDEMIDKYHFEYIDGKLVKTCFKYSSLLSETKTIPFGILNSSIDIKFEFISGILESQNNRNGIDVDSPVMAQGIYYLLKSIGIDKLVIMKQNDKFNIISIDVPTSYTIINQIETSDEEEYVYDIETTDGTFHAGVGELIVKNTDSVYVNFPEHSGGSFEKLWDFCEHVEKEINDLFIKPLHLSFESAIYDRFFILTKKRYICLKADRNGKISDKLMIRGVLLTRRDNADIIRQIYKDTIMAIFYKDNSESILDRIFNHINGMFTRVHPLSSYTITKSIGDVQDYKTKPLSDDVIKRMKRLKDLNCDNEDDYKLKSLPANVQLAEKMRRRGKLVTAGQRIEYVITNMDKHMAKQFDKIEDYEYANTHSDVLNIDSLHYLKLMSKPLDEVLLVGINIDNFVEKQYKWRLQKWKCLNELKYYFKHNFKEILM